MGFVTMRAPDGRRWSLKEFAQGKPLGVPTHSLFVHFPVAFYLAVLVFDVMSRITPSPGLVQAGSYLLIGAAVATAAAALTGLIDWAGMVRGSSKRRLATRHMLLQLTAGAFFVVSFFLRWPNRTQPEADLLWIVLEAVGYLVIIVGQHLGGLLVYQKAMRVSTGGSQAE
ncbi:MAG TPA: DUF2231 domain-containing protein [Actinomycetota bacterium]